MNRLAPTFAALAALLLTSLSATAQNWRYDARSPFGPAAVTQQASRVALVFYNTGVRAWGIALILDPKPSSGALVLDIVDGRGTSHLSLLETQAAGRDGVGVILSDGEADLLREARAVRIYNDGVVTEFPAAGLPPALAEVASINGLKPPVPMITVKPADAPRPSARMSYDQAAEACDRLAGYAQDPDHQGPGVNWEDLDPSTAIAACRQAATAFPDEPRYRYQLGRALDKGDQREALTVLREVADEERYAAAANHLAVFFRDGRFVQRNLAEAERQYSRAVLYGMDRAAIHHADMLMKNADGEGDHLHAALLAQEASEKGDRLGDLRLAQWTHQGHYTGLSTAEAAEHARRASRDYSDGEYLLAQFYRYGGEDFPASREKYLYHLRRAADRNHGKAQVDLLLE